MITFDKVRFLSILAAPSKPSTACPTKPQPIPTFSFQVGEVGRMRVQTPNIPPEVPIPPEQPPLPVPTEPIPGPVPTRPTPVPIPPPPIPPNTPEPNQPPRPNGKGYINECKELGFDIVTFPQSHSDSPGPEGIKQIVSMFRTAFPDLKITIEHQVGDNEYVCSRTVTRGTQKGDLFGISATGKTVTVPGLTMVHIVDGRLVESWVKNDMVGLLNQLGSGWSR